MWLSGNDSGFFLPQQTLAENCTKKCYDPTLAVMHKLLRILLGLYKHPGAYDATKAFPTHVHTLELEAVAA